MINIDLFIASLQGGPDTQWLADNSQVVSRVYGEMLAERDLAMRSLCSRRSGGSSTPSQQVVSGKAAIHYRGDGL